MATIDFLMDPETGDIMIKDGDFVIGESDQQHIEHIILAAPGNYRRSPLTGFNVHRFRNAPWSERDRFVRDLTTQLELDGYKVNDIVVRPDQQGQIDIFKIEVDAYRP